MTLFKQGRIPKYLLDPMYNLHDMTFNLFYVDKL